MSELTQSPQSNIAAVMQRFIDVVQKNKRFLLDT
jgi:hypothetical protein